MTDWRYYVVMYVAVVLRVIGVVVGVERAHDWARRFCIWLYGDEART